MALFIPFAAAASFYAATAPSSSSRAAILVRTNTPLMYDGNTPLAEFLEKDAGVAPKFLPAVLSTCDDEMIGSVANLNLLAETGTLGTIFKPVIAASIEAALKGGSVGGGGGGGGASAMAPGAAMPLADVKRLLKANGQDTWGSEADLRARADMFIQQEAQSAGAHWDSDSKTWSA